MLTVGVEDGSFRKGITQKALLAAVLVRGTKIENVKIIKITVDGLDATEKLANLLKEWEFDGIMLAGVSFAGFNLIDPIVMYEEFQKPITIISRTRPNNKAVKRALERHFEDWEIRWRVFQKLGPVYKIFVQEGEAPLYIETVGASVKWASEMVRAFSFCGRVPEPIRVARLIARGLS
ncbi:MAG: endonuclease dU [Candidatus Bathycorpusculaceae bacterium]